MDTSSAPDGRQRPHRTQVRHPAAGYLGKGIFFARGGQVEKCGPKPRPGLPLAREELFLPPGFTAHYEFFPSEKLSWLEVQNPLRRLQCGPGRRSWAVR